MMYSAYKLNKQGDNIQPWCTPFPVLSQSLVPCPILIVASCPVYRFLRKWVKWSSIPISSKIFQFVVIHTVKGFNVVSEAEVDFFFNILALKTETEEELKNLLMKVKDKSEKAGLKLNIQITKIMASHPITSCHVDEETWKQWQTLFSWAPKSLQIVTAAMKFKKCLLLGRKALTNLDSILISRDITLLTKIHIVKAMVFSVVMYGCESWTMKKTEQWRIEAFKPWCWRRVLRVPWTARRSDQSIPKEVNPEYSLEGPVLKLKLQYFGHLMQRADSLEKTLILGKIVNKRRQRLQDEMVGWHH